MCGIVGIVGRGEVAYDLYDALTVLQHRGQDAAGIVTCEGDHVRSRKSNGLVRDVFHQGHMNQLKGNMGIAHVRYPTAGTSSSAEAQPMYVNSPFGICLAHNGNLINDDELNEDLFRADRRHINTSSDSEVLLNVFAHELQDVAGMQPAPEEIFKAIEGINKSIRGEYEITDALQNMPNQIHILEYKGLWMDIGNPWNLISANEEYMKNNIKNIEGTIEENVMTKGEIHLGKGSILKSGTYLEGPIWIGENCVVGPNSYLRPGTVLCGMNKVGASTEIKNSILLRGAKAPHHNYVGDSIIGENSNLGSGTKIANLRFDKKEIEVVHRGKKTDSRRRKLGAIIGNNVNTGINASINAGSILGNCVKVGPNTIVSGTYESQSTIA